MGEKFITPYYLSIVGHSASFKGDYTPSLLLKSTPTLSITIISIAWLLQRLMLVSFYLESI